MNPDSANPSEPFPPHPRIAVVGAGALGSYYGAMLAKAGGDVHFLMRSDYAHVKEHGLSVTSKSGGDFHLPVVNCYQSPEEIGPCDLVIIGLKTTANDAMIDLVRPVLGDHTAILTLQNGLGADELLAENFGGDRVLGGLCFVCLNRTAPGQVVHIGAGRVTVGEFSGGAIPRTRQIAAEFRRSGVDCSTVDDLARERWKKLVWNIPFNGLSIAEGGITTDQILADPELHELTLGLMGETIEAARSLGYELPESLAHKMVENTYPMGAYKPSSMIDYLSGSPVEIESIWGEPSRRGRAAGAEVGRIERLHSTIASLCQTRDRAE